MAKIFLKFFKRRPHHFVVSILLFCLFFANILHFLLSPFLHRKFCEGAPCIFDLGHNSGQDTADYLSTGLQGTRVLAVDANPILISKSTLRFAQAIREGRLKLINAGLGRHSGESLTFWVNSGNNLYSSFKEELGCRTKYGGQRDDSAPRKNCISKTIRMRTCANLVEEFGTPTYLKIDIEGMDVACLDSLKALYVEQRPRYVSMEKRMVTGSATIDGIRL